MSDSALGGLKSMLEGGPDEYDWMPPGLRDQAARDQLGRQIEHLDPRSASDAHEAINAIELMRKQAADMPPAFPGRPTPGASPLPGRQEREGVDRRRLAGDSRVPVKVQPFHKMLGLKKSQLPRAI